MSNQYKNGIFGCFGDFRLCLITFFAPCYTMGKNAEHFGEDCMLHGLLTAVGFQFGPTLRWRLRQEKNLEGSMIMDYLFYMCLPCCAAIQDAREIGWGLPEAVANVGKKTENEMTRE